MTPLGDGMSIECTEEKFDELLEEVKPVANRIVDSLKQDAEA